MAAKQLTPAHQETLVAIYQLNREKGYMPTAREIAKHLQMSKYAIQIRIEKLISMGYLNTKGDLTARSMYFTKTIEYQGQTIPVLGVCN